MIVTGYGQAAETDFVLFSRNLLRSTSRVASVCHIVDTDGAAEETSYLFDLLRYLHRAQNYIMSSHVLL